MRIRRLHPSLPGRGALVALCAALGAAGCARRDSAEPPEQVYVRGTTVPLRDELGPASREIGTLQSGEKVAVLAKRPRWVQVRSARGDTGWVQQQYLASQEVFDRFRGLADKTVALPSQGKAIARRAVNLHLEPGAESEMLYRLAEGEGADVLSHRVAERASRPSINQRTSRGGGSEAPAAADLEVKGSEDWLLVRASGDRAGWAPEAAMDMNVPIEVAQYSEGLRIRAWFVLNVEQDQKGEHPWYLWATVRPRRGWPFDYDEIRVFVWDPRNSRYETSYRQRNLIGFYPIRVGRRATPGGQTPAFSLQLEDEKGSRFERNYFMVGRQARVER